MVGFDVQFHLPEILLTFVPVLSEHKCEKQIWKSPDKVQPYSLPPTPVLFTLWAPAQTSLKSKCCLHTYVRYGWHGSFCKFSVSIYWLYNLWIPEKLQYAQTCRKFPIPELWLYEHTSSVTEIDPSIKRNVLRNKDNSLILLPSFLYVSRTVLFYIPFHLGQFPKTMPIIFCFGTGNQTLDLALARWALCHWAKSPVPIKSIRGHKINHYT